jgi:uncharacterized delta-60 repeat protein
MTRRLSPRRLRLDRLEDRVTPSNGTGVMAPVPTGPAGSALVPIPGPIDRRAFTPFATAPTADGKVWVIGTIDTPPDSGGPGAPIPVDYIAYPGRGELALIRLTADGFPDPAFNGGRAKVLPDAIQSPFYYGPRIDRLAISPDGKLLVLTSPNVIAYAAATDTPAPAAPLTSLSTVSRLNSDGTLDPTFGTGGQVAVDFGASAGFLSAAGLAVGPDGKVVVVSSGNYSAPTVTVVRLTASGQLDPTFDGDGRQQVEFDLTDQPDSASGVDVAVTADGKILVGGTATELRTTWTVGDPPARSAFAVARLNPDGSLDTTFDGDGVQFVGFDLGAGSTTGFLSDLALTPDGGVLLAGSATAGGEYYGRGVAAKLTAAGQLDPAFGAGGRLAPAFDSRATVTAFGAAAVRPDGRFLLAGTEVADDVYGAVLGQFLPDGIPDPGFVTYRPNPAPPGTTYIQELSVLPDGRVLVRSPGQLSAVTADGLCGVEWTVPYWALPPLPPPPGWPTKPRTQLPDPADVFPGFTGAVRTAVADVNGDGVADTIYATGSGDARLAVYGGQSLAAGAPARLVGDFFGLDDLSFRGGVSVAADDFNGDGFADLAIGAGDGGAPVVRLVDGRSLTRLQSVVTQQEFVAGGWTDDRAGTSLETDGWVQDRQTRLVIRPAARTGREVVVFTPPVVPAPPPAEAA